MAEQNIPVNINMHFYGLITTLYAIILRWLANTQELFVLIIKKGLRVYLIWSRSMGVFITCEKNCLDY